jgi:hypothetical protein
MAAWLGEPDKKFGERHPQLPYQMLNYLFAFCVTLSLPTMFKITLIPEFL